MALTAEERNYALGIMLKYASITPRGDLDLDKFFDFIEADEATKRTMIKEYITKELIPQKEASLARYNQLVISEQTTIDDLNTKVKP
jgi:hypothetical protein